MFTPEFKTIKSTMFVVKLTAESIPILTMADGI